jgi:hypothetical protein
MRADGVERDSLIDAAGAKTCWLAIARSLFSNVHVLFSGSAGCRAVLSV